MPGAQGERWNGDVEVVLRPRWMRRHVVLMCTVGTITAVIGLSIGASRIRPENPRHAADHLAVAVPCLVLCVALIRTLPPPKPTWLGRLGRRTIIVGLAMVVTGLVVEAVGKFGYDGDESRVKVLTSIHNGSWLISFPAMFVLLVGLFIAAASLPHRPPTHGAPTP